MRTPQEIRLGELLAAIAFVGDLGRGQPPESALRTCLVALRIATRLGLDAPARRDLHHAALIHPVGCAAFTYESARTFGTNELVDTPAYLGADPTSTRESLAAMRTSLRGVPAARRPRAAVRNATSGAEFLRDAVRADCEAGASFTRRIGGGATVAATVVQARERWDGRGLPAGLRGEEIQVGARVLALAEQVEISHRTHGAATAYAMAARRAGRWFDPAVVAAFHGCARDALAELDGGAVWDAVMAAEPAPATVIDEGRLDDVALALADLVDLKSPFLLGHSRGVAELARAAAIRLGHDEAQATALRRAGLLHDLGRVGVTNLVWDRPRSLTESEWEQVRLHPYHTERILLRSTALAPFAQVAGMHHERPDGTGYHRGATAAAMPVAARVLAAADRFHALTEPRPHRPALSHELAAQELERMVAQGAVDPEAARAVCDAAGVALPTRTPGAWPAGLTEREVEVLRLLARGRSKKEIARVLVIAPGTVHTHTVHIYGKLGVSTRAGVALFAAEHGLVAT